MPSRFFKTRRLSVDEVKASIQQITEIFSEKHIILTVSPVRHVRDGLHENQLNKAVLLMAIDEVIKQNDQLVYFPAYELMLDQLRDYRFYDTDLVHPSETATELIFNSFTQALCSSDCISRLDEWEKLERSLNHRPFNPDSEKHRLFLSRLNSDLNAYFARYHVPDKTRKEALKHYNA